MNQIFVISDIFGRTPALERLVQDLTVPGTCADILDPYKGTDQGFASEAHAYDAFMSRTGLESYREIVKEQLGSVKEPACLIGFSVGATAVWQISGDPAFKKKVVRAYCFYPSRIRHFPDIQPCFEIELIFPISEPAFDVNKMMALQAGKSNVTCRKEKGKHGFMNALSPHYDESMSKNNQRDLAAKIEKERLHIRKIGRL